jgi:N-acetylglucosamine-6-phosphate deacetylase
MGQPFVCDTVLDRHGSFREAKIAWRRDGVSEWQVGDPVAPRRPFVVDGLPVEAHCHGIGPYDFSVIGEADLDDVEAALAREGTFCVPSMFIGPARLRAVEAMLEKFSSERRRFPHILGFAFEGPLLGSTGGTPQIGSWHPSREDWESIAMLGRLGLLYIVLSPDELRDRADLEAKVSLLTANGVAVALGHFGKADSSGSAQAIRDVIDIVASGADSRRFVWTDHLFNDMPLEFRHAWRTALERAARDREVAALRLDEWSLSNLASKVGAVPAALITAAADDEITLFLNFDGEHVDTAVARRTVELVGDASLIALTDRTDTHSLAGVQLEMKPDSSLWYADSGVVAAGSCSADRQRELLLRQGYSDASAWRLTALNALRLLDVPSTECSYVSENGARTFMHRLV